MQEEVTGIVRKTLCQHLLPLAVRLRIHGMTCVYYIITDSPADSSIRPLGL